MATQPKTVTKLLATDYVYRGVIYEAGIREVPEDFEPGTPVGAPSTGSPLTPAAAKLLVGLDDEGLRAALELRGTPVAEGATREEMLASVGLTGAGQPAPQVADYEASWNKDDLQREAEKRGLTVEGSGKDGNVLKSDLVAALQADDAARAAAQPPA